MHIVFHTHEYPGEGRSHGGVGTVVRFLARRFARQGIRVSVVGINNKTIDEYEEDGPVKIYRLSRSRWKMFRFIDQTNRILTKLKDIHREYPIDIVEGAELTFAFYPKNTPFKKVIRLHGGHHFFALELGRSPKFWRSFQEKQSFKKADGYIAVSDYVGRKTREYLRYDFPYEVIYNTLDEQFFQPVADVGPQENSILFYGTVCEKKGIRQLVMAMPEILRQVPDAQLNIVGRDWFFPDGRSYIEYLQTFIPETIKPHIHFLGKVPHEKIKEFLANNEVVALPSHMESFGMTWVEAFLMAKPFVGSNVGPGPEIVKNGETGFLVNPREPQEIAGKIVWLLQNKPQARQMGQKAREYALKLFHPEKIIAENIRFYEELLQS